MHQLGDLARSRVGAQGDPGVNATGGGAGGFALGFGLDLEKLELGGRQGMPALDRLGEPGSGQFRIALDAPAVGMDVAEPVLGVDVAHAGGTAIELEGLVDVLGDADAIFVALSRRRQQVGVLAAHGLAEDLVGFGVSRLRRGEPKRVLG